MEIDEIEMRVASGCMSAAQVFTQMKQHTSKDANGVLLAEECVENLRDSCSCHEAYTSRNMTDHNCEYCNIGQHILPIAKRIIGR